MAFGVSFDGEAACTGGWTTCATGEATHTGGWTVATGGDVGLTLSLS